MDTHAHAPSHAATQRLSDELRRSHHHLAALYGRLLEAMEADAREVRALWTELDDGLRAHMEAEERFVLPAFARVDPEEAVALLQDHGRIRVQLLELGVAIDLHQIRYARSADFIETLRAHAAREDQLLYRWVDRALDRELAVAAAARVESSSRQTVSSP